MGWGGRWGGEERWGREGDGEGRRDKEGGEVEGEGGGRGEQQNEDGSDGNKVSGPKGTATCASRGSPSCHQHHPPYPSSVWSPRPAPWSSR